MRLLCIHIPDLPDDDPDEEMPQLVIGNEYNAIDRKSHLWITLKLIALNRNFIAPKGIYYKLREFPNGYYHESYFGLLDSGIEEKELELITSGNPASPIWSRSEMAG